jgi:hypothetical protein
MRLMSGPESGKNATIQEQVPDILGGYEDGIQIFQ